MQLLSEIGIRDGSPFESNGITGGDLLDLDDEELKEDLHLTNLQVPCPTCVHDPFVSHVMFASWFPLSLKSTLGNDIPMYS